jgi:hypothetical protein
MTWQIWEKAVFQIGNRIRISIGSIFNWIRIQKGGKKAKIKGKANP